MAKMKVSINVEGKLLAEIEAAAKRMRRSRSDTIVTLIMAGLRPVDFSSPSEADAIGEDGELL